MRRKLSTLEISSGTRQQVNAARQHKEQIQMKDYESITITQDTCHVKVVSVDYLPKRQKILLAA